MSARTKKREAGAAENETAEIRIESLAPGGDGVGTSGDHMWFVRGAVPGDLVVAKVTGKTKRNVFASISKILERSPHRMPPKCEVFGECGGCSYLHVDYETQVENKRRELERRFDFPDVQMVASTNPLRYRRVARLRVNRPHTGSAGVGFLAKRSNRTVDIESCPILVDRLNGALRALREGPLGSVKGDGELILAQGENGVFALLKTRTHQPQELYEQARGLHPDTLSGVLLETDGITSTLAGEDAIRVKGVDGLPLLMPVGSFGQANEAVNAEIAHTIGEWVSMTGPYATCHEYFSGAGNYSVILAPLVKKISLVELDRRASELSGQNLEARGLSNWSKRTGEAHQEAESLGRAQLVVLDPPRTGDLELAKTLSKGPQPTVIYVSCNPQTLKRDVDVLLEEGFSLEALTGFDMFPQTPHIEAAALLRRR